MSRKLLTVRVEELVVKSNGDFPGTRPSHDDDLGLKNNSLIAALTYPRSGAPLVLSVKQYDLENGKPASLVSSDPFFDPLLFREEVLDRSVLTLRVTNLDQAGKAAKFFLKIFSVVLGAGLGAATAGLGNVLGAVVGFGIDGLKGRVSSAGDQEVDVIGEARIDLDMDDWSEVPRRVSLPLVPPTTVRRRGFVLDPETHQPVQQEMTVTEKGVPNGSITLSIAAALERQPAGALPSA